MVQMRCTKCGKVLKDKQAIARGMGKVCWSKFLAEHGIRNQREIAQILIEPFDGDIKCFRSQNGTPHFNIRQDIVKHSPTGMEWGFGGSGPADFALNILARFIGREKAEQGALYQQFKWDVVAKIPGDGGTVKQATILGWISKHCPGLIPEAPVKETDQVDLMGVITNAG